MQAPVLILNQNTKRDFGRKAQLSNIVAAKSVADIVRTTLGPRSMLKMILDPMGGILMTNDGNAILREIDVSHPAAKSMIELARTQDEEVGDGTTSVIILGGELLSTAEPLLNRNLHPRTIVAAYLKALEDALAVLDKQAITIDVHKRETMLTLVRSCLGTKLVSKFGDLVCNLALEAVLRVTVDSSDSKEKEVDIKRYARIEKIPGGFLEESKVLDGVMLNKDVIHPNMRRSIKNPRVVLLDCPLEFKKAESQTSIEIKKEEDWETVLKMEEQSIKKMCQHIIAVKPDLVCTEKGVSDLAAHFLSKANISVLRRLKKTDSNRIARATGAQVVSIPEELKDSDVGTRCGLFDISKIGEEYWAYIVQCADAKACTVVLRGASKDVLNEIERNLHDAMAVVRNIVLDPRVVAGGGAIELAVAQHLLSKSKVIDGSLQWPYRVVAQAPEVIPRTLIENCGASPIRLLTQVRAKHVEAEEKGARCTFGIDGNKGEVADTAALNILEPLAVKAQTLKTAVESACMLLRIDEIVSGISGKGKEGGGAPAAGGDPEQQEEGGAYE